jgi:hypothetical protein
MAFLEKHVKVAQILSRFWLVGMIGLGLYFIFFHKEDKNVERSLGFYYPYHSDKDGKKSAVVVWRSAGDPCVLIPRYAADIYGSPAKDLPYYDTVRLPMDQALEVIGIDCDSSVGTVKFPNRFFDARSRVSNLNQPYTHACISLSDLHLE